MRPISPKFRKIINEDPYYRTCANPDPNHSGRMTIEHAWCYASRQIDELWNFVPLCWHHHLGEGLNKKLNQIIALNRATPEDLQKYPNKNWSAERRSLEYDLRNTLHPQPL